MAVTTAAKCTFFFSQSKHGWSETYYTIKTIEDAYVVCSRLGDSLIRLRGSNTSISALRISLVACPTNQGPAPRMNQLFPPKPTWNQGGAVIAPTETGGSESDSFSACILARCIPANAAIGVKSIFMGGMPDRYDIEGGKLLGSFTFMYGTPVIRAWQEALSEGGFGWLGQTLSPLVRKTAIRDITIGADGVPVIKTFNGLTGLDPAIVNAPGVYLPIRLSGITQPGNLNGVWPFSVSTGTEVGAIYLTMKKSVATLAWDGTGKCTYAPLNFIPFSTATVGSPNPVPIETAGNIYAAKIAKRKRGRPFGSQPGRRRTIPVS